MPKFEFRLAGLTEEQIERREFRRQQSKLGKQSVFARSQFTIAGLKISLALMIKAALVVLVVYLVTHPAPRIDPSRVLINTPAGAEVTDRRINISGINQRIFQLTGNVPDRKTTSVTLYVGKGSVTVPVEDGKFAVTLPLFNGANPMQVVAGNAASQIINVTAQIPTTDIWIQLSWDGPEDIDLHLLLPGQPPDQSDCYFANCTNGRKVGGATLDIDKELSKGGFGPEHIFSEVAHGHYVVQVVYYATKDRFPRPVHWQCIVVLERARLTRSFSGVLFGVKSRQTVWEFDLP